VELLGDSALRSIPDTGDFTGWLAGHVVEDSDWEQFVPAVPLSRIYLVADRARACAVSWRAFADALEGRLKRQQAG
jgi:hypothetical protein